MQGDYHILHFGLNEDFKPELKIRNINNSNVESRILQGVIDVVVKPNKYCIGTYDGTSFKICLRKIDKYNQCYSCFKQSPKNLCAKCNGEKCLLDQKICPSHKIYLASFGNEIKIGVTSSKRFPLRVIEQGADFASAIAETEDGLTARKIEKAIKEKFGIKDKITTYQKYELINNDKAKELGKELIKTTYYNIIDQINAENKLDLDIIDLSYNYMEVKNSIYLLVEENTRIYGKIIGNKGHLIFIKNKEGLYTFNASSLISRILSFSF